MRDAYVLCEVKLEELQRHFGCSCEGQGGLRHVASCSFSPHAAGPVCNLLGASLRLPKPVACSGELGCWRLPDEVREEVAKQLNGLEVFHFKEERPQAWPLPWAKHLSREDVFWHRAMSMRRT